MKVISRLRLFPWLTAIHCNKCFCEMQKNSHKISSKYVVLQIISDFLIIFPPFYLTELCNDLLFQMASKYKLQTLMTSASNAITAISFISHCISALQGLTLLCKVLLPNIPLNCNFYNFKPKSFYVFRLTFNGRKYRLQFVISLLFIVLQFPHKSSKRPFGHHHHAYQLPRSNFLTAHAMQFKDLCFSIDEVYVKVIFMSIFYVDIFPSS